MASFAAIISRQPDRRRQRCFFKFTQSNGLKMDIDHRHSGFHEVAVFIVDILERILDPGDSGTGEDQIYLAVLSLGEIEQGQQSSQS